MEHIASAQNSRIKHLAKLAASAAKRRAFGQTLLEGTHLLEAFLNAGGRPECVYVAENRLEDAEISALLQRMPSEKTVSAFFRRPLYFRHHLLPIFCATISNCRRLSFQTA